jgi:hypothetical protein
MIVGVSERNSLWEDYVVYFAIDYQSMLSSGLTIDLKSRPFTM